MYLVEQENSIIQQCRNILPIAYGKYKFVNELTNKEIVPKLRLKKSGEENVSTLFNTIHNSLLFKVTFVLSLSPPSFFLEFVIDTDLSKKLLSKYSRAADRR